MMNNLLEKAKGDEEMNHIHHLIYILQENEQMQLSDKSIRDITETILGANREATKGSIENMKEWRQKYFELKQGS